MAANPRAISKAGALEGSPLRGAELTAQPLESPLVPDGAVQWCVPSQMFGAEQSSIEPQVVLQAPAEQMYGSHESGCPAESCAVWVSEHVAPEMHLPPTQRLGDSHSVSTAQIVLQAIPSHV